MFDNTQGFIVHRFRDNRFKRFTGDSTTSIDFDYYNDENNIQYTDSSLVIVRELTILYTTYAKK